jgi:2-amino-4-hydroxy-6-hydroxymethyldihydropteridine diphosphokinase
MESVYLGLGSNRGDSLGLFRGAIERIQYDHSLVTVSRFYRTEPRYVTDQPCFLNAVVACATDFDPLDFLAYTQALEADFGRDRSRERRYGERSLDIDILLWGNMIFAFDALRIPHPLLPERKFALLPLLDVYPEARDPYSGQLYLENLLSLEAQGIYYETLAGYS